MDGSLLDGRYRLTARLAGGGMGEVWRAVDERIGRDVAVKIVTAARLTPDALARFDREARIAGNLSGPNIVTVHDYGQSVVGGETVPYLVMELVSGRTLGQIVDTADRLPPLTRSLRWAMQICDALEIAHRAGVVHRDIKPGNVMVTDEGPVKVLDFGIARFVEDEQLRSGLTATGMIIGSAEYLSPEQADGRKADYRSDLYSLGVLLHFLATGRPPFEADSFMALAYQHSTKQPDPPSTHRLGLPPEFDALVMELLAKDPSARPESAAAVRKRLSTLLRQERDRERAAGAGGGAAGGSSGEGAAAGAGGGAASASTSSGSAGAGAPKPNPTSDTPTPGVTPPATGLWSAPQATEVRRYPGDPGPVFPISPQPSTKVEGKPSRRVFIGAATVAGLGAAGGAGWWLLSGSKKPGTTDGASGPTSLAPAATTPHTGATTPSATPAPSAAPSSTAAGPTALPPLAGHTKDIPSVVFSADSDVLASASFDHTARLWDSSGASPTLLGVCTGHTDGLWGVAFSPDGHTLATASADKTGRLWDIRDPRKPVAGAKLSGFTGMATCVAFSPGGHTVAVGSADGAIRLWSVSSASSVGLLTSLAVGAVVYSLAFSPDGHTLAVGSFDSIVHLWNLNDPTTPAALPALTGHTDKVFDIAFSPDGSVLAASSADKTVRLWKVTDPMNAASLGSLAAPDATTGAAFSPDGHTFAAGCVAGAAQLWTVKDPAHAVALPPLPGAGYMYGVVFSPDGRFLAAGSADKQVHLWKL